MPRSLLLVGASGLLALGVLLRPPVQAQSPGAPGSSPPASQSAVAASALHSRLQALAREAERKGIAQRVGLVVVADGDDEPAAAYRHREDFPAASVIKIPVMLALHTAWNEGRLKRQARHAELMRRMMQVSDNAATNALVDLLTLGAVNRELQQITGKSNPVTRFARKLNPSAPGPPKNRAAPAEVAQLLSYISSRERAGHPAGTEMLRVMRGAATNHRTRIPQGVPPPHRQNVANKTGTLNRVVNDSAIVQTPDRRRYVLVIFLDGVKAHGSAEAFCRQVSALCWRELAQPAER